MSITEQIEVLEALKNGKDVYKIKNWDAGSPRAEEFYKKVDNDELFDFNPNTYFIGKPKTFIEMLCGELTTTAFKKVVDRCIDLNDCTEPNGHHIKMVKAKDLYKFWNIAVKYGRETSDKSDEIIPSENPYK